MRFGVCTALAMISSHGCSPQPEAENPAREGEVREAIAASQRAWSEAIVNGDTATIISLYTDDAVLMPPGGEFRGPAGVREWLASAPPDFKNVSHSTTVERLAVYDTIAVEQGLWHSTFRIGDGPEQSASDRYLVVWKLSADGRWRYQYDMWHVPLPPPTP
jgi:ketosteroid isomerase-like protein